jgi:hypothetical protein
MTDDRGETIGRTSMSQLRCAFDPDPDHEPKCMPPQACSLRSLSPQFKALASDCNARPFLDQILQGESGDTLGASGYNNKRNPYAVSPKALPGPRLGLVG